MADFHTLLIGIEQLRRCQGASVATSLNFRRVLEYQGISWVLAVKDVRSCYQLWEDGLRRIERFSRHFRA